MQDKRPSAFSLAGGVLSLLLAFPVSSLAFNKDEHRELGNDALRAVGAYLEATGIEIDILCTAAGREDSECAFSGLRQLVACLAGDSDCAARSCSSDADCGGGCTYGHQTELVDDFVNPMAKIRAVLAETRSCCVYEVGSPAQWSCSAKSRAPEDKAKAMHDNWQHFGFSALQRYDALHRQALSLARSSDLLTALQVNAFADHYLQDALVPGHIATSRTHLSDKIAWARHDYINQKGGCFFVDSGRDLLADAARFGVELSQQLKEQLAVGGQPSIALLGDGKLGQGDQRSLMLLLTARSILDVFEAYLDPASQKVLESRLGGFRWAGYSLGRPLVGDPWFRDFLPPSKDRDSKEGLSCNNDDFPAVAELFVTGRPFFNFVWTPYGTARVYSRGSWHSATVVMSLTGETVRTASEPWLRWSAETNLGGSSSSTPQVRYALGVSYLQASDYDASGLTGRAILDVPKLDGEVSVFSRVDRFKLSEETWRTGYGLRLDVGFSVVKLHLELGRGHYFTESDELTSGTVIGAGLSGAFVASRASWRRLGEKIRGWKKKDKKRDCQGLEILACEPAGGGASR